VARAHAAPVRRGQRLRVEGDRRLILDADPERRQRRMKMFLDFSFGSAWS
jgi:predicted metalloprotease